MMTAQIDPCVVLWQAMNEAEKVGNRTDDKLIVEFLRRAGYCIAPAPAQTQQAEPVGYLYDFTENGETIPDWYTSNTSEATAQGHFNVRPVYTHPPKATGQTEPVADFAPIKATVKHMLHLVRIDNEDALYRSWERLRELFAERKLAATPAQAQQADLARDYARALDTIESHVAEIKRLEQQQREYSAFRNMVNRHDPKCPAHADDPRDVWYWQGDGEDHLESMAHQLPVVIRAEQLRELLAATKAEAKPLTDEQIDAMAHKEGDYDSRTCCWSFNGDTDCRYNLTNFARAIERAHGIGASSGGGNG